MRVFHYSSVDSEDVKDGAARKEVRWLITEKLEAINFVMRLFEIAPKRR